jgi:uncharacterized protein YjaZ
MERFMSPTAEGPIRRISAHSFDASGALGACQDVFLAGFQKATRWAGSLLEADAIDVLVINAPDETLPEWGVGGYTYGPHTILVALDPGATISEESVERTLLHEFHHAMRWRGPGCGGNLAQMLVSEGLAQLFEEEVLGSPPFFTATEISEEEIAQARAAMFAEPFNPSKWFFGSSDITRWFGYAYGYRLAKAYSLASGRPASQLVMTSTGEIVTGP